MQTRGKALFATNDEQMKNPQPSKENNYLSNNEKESVPNDTNSNKNKTAQEKRLEKMRLQLLREKNAKNWNLKESWTKKMKQLYPKMEKTHIECMVD